MIPDWFGIAALTTSAIFGVSSFVLLMSTRRARRRKPVRVENAVVSREIENLTPWLEKLRQLDVPDFEVLSVLKSRREQGVFGVRFINDQVPRVLKVFVHDAGAASMLTAQREIFATYLLGDGPTCLHPIVARTRDRSATALVRDRIPGETLLEFMAHRGRLLTLAEADVLVRRLCSATEELHQLGMIHCDIKPSNIVGEWSDAFAGRAAASIRLIDFGMFAPVDPQASGSGQVAVEGTPNFTAPERLFFSTASRASDVYSCAVVTAFALTGQPQSGLRYIPSELRLVLSRASSREADSRYSTIHQFSEAWTSAFRSLAATMDINRVAVTLPSWGTLREGAGRRTIPRSTLWDSASPAGAARASMDQDLLEFRERNAEIIGRLGAMLESRSESRDSAQLDALLRALESRLAEAETTTAATQDPHLPRV